MALKQLMLPANRAFNSNGAPIVAAQLKLYLSGTSTPANFLASDGVTSLGSTLTANGAGRFATPAYGDPNTAYRLKVLDSLGNVLDDLDPYFFGLSAAGVITIGTVATGAPGSSAAVTNSGSAAEAVLNFTIPQGAAGAAGDLAKVADTTALAAIVGPTANMTRYVTDSTHPGLFVFSSANLSTSVSSDPFNYIAPSSDTSGASGAWVRSPNYRSVLDRKHAMALPTGAITLPTQFNNQLGVEPYWDGSAVQYKMNPYDMIDFTRQWTWTITFTGQPNDGDTVTLDGKVYTFKTTLSNTDGYVKIGASTAATCTNLINAIRRTGGTNAGTAGTDYASATTPHTTLSPAQGAGTTITLGLKPLGIGKIISNTVSATNVTISSSINVYYVSYAIGADSGSGNTTTAPWKTLTYAVATAVSPAIVILLDNNLGINSWSSNHSFTGKLKILGSGPRGRTLISQMNENYNAAVFAFAPSGGASAYVCTNATQAILGSRAQFDMRRRDAHGIPKALKAAASIAACQSTPGTFFYDSGTTSLYVYMFDGRIPDPNDGWIYAYGSHFELQQGATDSTGVLLFENLEFCNNEGTANTSGAFRYRPVTTGASNTARVGLRNCLVFGSSGDGFQFYDGCITCVDNCHARYTVNDLFNYHSFINTGSQGSWITIYETNCSGFESAYDANFAGQLNAGTSVNGSTCHNGINILRSGGRFGQTNGSVIADVQGTVTVLLDVHAAHPGSGASPKACFWHSGAGVGTYSGMYMWGCAGNDDEDSATYLLTNNGAANGEANGQIYLKHWRGVTQGSVYGQVKDWAGNAL